MKIQVNCREGDLDPHTKSTMADDQAETRVPFKEHQQLQAPKVKEKSQAFVVDFGNEGSKVNNLQESFLKYRQSRQDEIREARRMKDLELKSRCDPDVMWGLRMKFLDQVKNYMGVPYAKKYWSPEEAEYNAPIFLDCCGLVRRALYDLEEDFGFKVGRWNQAYQHDVLPNTIEEEQMLPGDLVFIAATYYNPKSKRQRHDMVHVEVWLGDGPKTIGARWQRGKVQVFDSYDFVAKSYHSQKYIFKSIDTWLQGICKSYCSAHTWTRSLYDPSTKSVFAVEDEGADEESDADEDAGDTDDELICSFGDERDFQKMMGESGGPAKPSSPEKSDSLSTSSSKTSNNSCPGVSEGLCYLELADDKENASMTPSDADGGADGSGAAGSGNDKPAPTGNSGAGSSGSGSGAGGGGRPIKRGKKSPDAGGSGNPRGAVRINLGNQHPTFYIGGGNGTSLVESALVKLGWRRITDRHNEHFKLKWTECKSQINYGLFREGEQLVNHIPNCNLLTNKLGLLSSLQEHNRVTQGIKRGGRISMDDFVPETYRLDERGDKKAFLETYKDGEVWICKPTGMNQGKGIYLISSREEIENTIKNREEKQQSQRKTSRPMMTRIIQRYITNPLLVDNHKFDIRAYMHIASTVPYVVLYHKGYIRRTCEPYTDDISNLAVHLTNQFVQKKVESYKDNKDDTVWSMEQFNDYINDKVLPEKEGLIEKDWAMNVLPKIMQKIMMYCFNSVKHKLQQRLGFFELFGFDFMIDTDMRVWLIEVNTNPALHTNCEVLKDVLPPIVEESIHVSVECFDKKKKTQPLLPIQAMNGYNLMYHDDHRSAGAGTSLVTGPPIVPRCLSSKQRTLKPEEASKQNGRTSAVPETVCEEVGKKDGDETLEKGDSGKEKTENEQHPAKVTSEEKIEKPQLPRRSETKSVTNPVSKNSRREAAMTVSLTKSDSDKSKATGTNTKVMKSGWPSFMNKISPRTLSSGSNPMTLTPVTLSVATPVSLKMTHAHMEHKRVNAHRPIINKRIASQRGRMARPKSTVEDRSS